MSQCPSCKFELPEGARFCGRCGNVLQGKDRDKSAASSSDREFLPTLGESFGPIDPNREFGSTLGGPVDPDAEFQPTPFEPIGQVDPNREFGSTVGGPIDPNLGAVTVLGESVIPPHGSVPMVQGTPQVGGVPSVQGTAQDSFAKDALPRQGQPSPHQQASHLQPQHQPPAHQQPPAHLQPQHQPPAHQQPLHLRPQISHQHAASAPVHHAQAGSRASHLSQRGCRPSCLTTVISSAVVVAIIASVAVFFLPAIRNALGHGQPPPALILNGSVVPGGLLSIHGSNFTSGGTITVTVDGHPATVASSSSGSQAPSGALPLASFALGAYQAVTAPAPGTTVTVRSDGTFDITIRIDPNWSVGSSHVVAATEQSSGQTAQLTITVPQRPALTSCSTSTTTTTLTLGPVTAGQTQPVAAPFVLCTTGSGSVSWNASWNQKQAPWLQLGSSGKIQAPLAQQLQVSASAAGLNAGTYQATVTFSSQGSSLKELLKVTFIVRAASATACINASTQALSFFATQGQGNPSSQTITIANCGASGAWSASTNTDDGAKWLSVGSNGSQLQSKATQDVPVQVTSTNLSAGTYTGQVTFKMGSSTTTVNVTLTVQPPAQHACIIANPTALGFTAVQGQGDPGAQTATVGNCGSSGNWSASTSTTDGANWLSVSPANGTLNANGTRDVSIAVTSAGLQIGTYTGQVTFKMGSSTATLSVFFTVQQMQQQSCLNSSSRLLDFTATQGQGYDPDLQTLTLANCGPSGDWSVSTANNSSWLGVSLTHGHLSAGATQSVGVSVSIGSLNANTYHDVLIFTLGSSTAKVDVTFTVLPPTPTPIPPAPTNTPTPTLPPILIVNVTNVGSTDARICPFDSGSSTWTCMLTLTEDASSQGNLNWSASTDLSGVSFNPPSGTLSPGQSAQETITIPASSCTNGKGTFNFAVQGGKTVPVSWTCTISTPTPAPTDTPTPIPPAPTNTPTPTLPPILIVNVTNVGSTDARTCPFDSGSSTWTCTLTLTEDASSQGNLNWSASTDLSGVSFNPPSGTLSPGQSAPETITIPASSCRNGKGTFNFAVQGGSPVAVSWTCTISTPPPAPTDTPTPVPPAPTDTPTPVPAVPTDTPTPVPPAPTDTPPPVPAVPTDTPTPVPPAPTDTPTPVPPAPTDTPTPVPPAPTDTPTPVPPAPTDTPTPVPPAPTDTPTPPPPA